MARSENTAKWDIARRDAGKTTHSQDALDGLGAYPLVSVAELLGEVVGRLQIDYKFKLHPTPDGRWAGFDLYRQDRFVVPGIKTPENFRRYKKVEPSDRLAYNEFTDAVRAICGAYQTEEYDKPVRDAYASIFKAFSDGLSNRNTVVFHIASSWQGDDHMVRTSLNGANLPHKFVPPSDWFSEELQNYNTADLLTLLPDAEKDQFMLILGRAVAGANGTETMEGLLEHTFRAYAILVGTEAGMGKSTLLGYLSGAMEVLGYKLSTINADFNKFGWGPIAVSDLALLDDMTDKVQLAMLTEPRIKSIVTGGTFKAEDKGIAAVDVKPKTVFIGCANGTNYAHFFGLDSGSLARTNQLDTRNTEELREALGSAQDFRILPFWRAEAKRMGCKPVTLACLLLRQCLDLFLETTGHSFDSEGLLVKQQDQDLLETRMKSNRTRFIIDVSLRHSEELPEKAAQLVALAIAGATGAKREELLRVLPEVDFSPDLLRLLLLPFVDATIKVPEEVQLRFLSKNTRPYLLKKMSDLGSMHQDKSYDAAFQLIISQLKSVKGFNYPKTTTHYQSSWIAVRRMIPTYVRRYEDFEPDDDNVAFFVQVRTLISGSLGMPKIRG